MRAGRDRTRASARHEMRFAVLRRQLPFAVVTAVAVLVALTWAPWVFGDGLILLPLVCAVTATLLAAAVPWAKLPQWAATVVPLLNMLAVALAEHAGLPAGVLILLPVLVLARTGTYGLALAICGAVAASWAPALLAEWPFRLTVDATVDIVLRPTVIVAAAIVLYLTERRSSARLALLAAQSALVEELLNDTRADRELLRTVLDTIQTKVVVLDGDGTIQRVNRATAQVYGDELVPGRKAEDAVVPLLETGGNTDTSPETSTLVRAARGERFAEEIVWTRRPDGARAAYRVSAAPFDGGAGGSVLAMEELTRELEALARREEFVSAVSHELRTPLTSVVGYLDLACDDPTLSEDGRRNLAIAERNARRLQILIENLLAAARGQERPISRAVDLSAVVHEVVEDQTLRATDARVALRVDGPPQCMVHADRDRLIQVVDNLVSNAIKYSLPGGEVTVTVVGGDDAARPEDDIIRLVVQDRGRGIAADEVPHVFDRFYRAPAARESTVQGTGLGLAITRQIVQDLGGSITLDSAPQDGTSVTVNLPRGAR